MKKNVVGAGILVMGLLGFGMAANAGLISYTSDGVDLVYDDDYTPVGASTPGLTWTANANLAATETFGLAVGTSLGTYAGDPSGYDGYIYADGLMNWPGALFWIDAMNAANYGGANDWRLFSALNADGSDPCVGVNCIDSELGHLFYTEGGLSFANDINSSAALTDVFNNMESYAYWSGTPYAPVTDSAWHFYTNIGLQNNFYKYDQFYAWAVRPGQVAGQGAAVPLPGTVALMGAGLLGFGVQRRRRSVIR